MLDKVMVVDSLPAVLQRQVLPYVRQHSLNENEILAAYVKVMCLKFGDKFVILNLLSTFDVLMFQTTVQSAYIDIHWE